MSSEELKVRIDCWIFVRLPFQATLLLTIISTPLQAKGNTAFSAGNFDEAITHFTDAIATDPSNHVLFSNRSAAYASLQQYQTALEDALKVTQLKPDWPKGYSRLGAAYFGLKDWDAAVEAYSKGLSFDPNNAQLMTGLANAQDAFTAANNAATNASSSSPAGSMSGLFSNPQVITRLATNPQTRTLLTQPDFMSMLKEIDSNPDAMQKYLQDDRFQLALQVGLGMSVTTPDAFMKQEDEKKKEENEVQAEEGRKINGNDRKEEEAKSSTNTKETTTKDEAMTEEEWEEVNCQKEALKEKEAGNEAYKKREFDQAIAHYDRAMELYDKDVSFLSNRAAVYFEMQDYAKCIADCEQAVEKGREMRTDFKLIARALARKGNALVKLGQLEEAIAVYNRSLTEHRAADTLKKLHEAEKTLKDQREQEYIDMGKCEEEKEKGNLAFKQQKYPEAVKHYTEALKRGPAKVNPEAYKLFSNRAACYTKLGAWQDGIKDADECIALKPDFPKGYSRKGHLQYFMKEYNKAMETYEKGLSKDPDNAELKEGLGRCVQAINRMNRGMEEGVSEDEMRLRQEKAMADPEIQGILTDPVMRNVLRDMQEDPEAAQKHLRHPEVAKKLEKLIAAGIVKVQ